MKKRFLRVAAVVVCSTFLFSSPGFAGGFRIHEQSASAMGMSSAFVGQADDSSAVWYNPAGITGLDGTNISAGVMAIYPVITHETTTGTTEVSERAIHLPIHLYGTHRLNDRLSLGLGVNNPFGLSTDWDPNTSSTRYVATFTKINTTNINPNIAYKLNDKLSVAAGIDYVVVRSTMEKILGLGDQNFRLSGDGDGWGANFALKYKASDSLNLGLSYRSRIRVDVDGTADVIAIGSSNPASTEVTLPDLILFGASYKASDKLTINADLDYTMWSTYDRLVMKSNTFVDLGFGTDTFKNELQWKDVWCIRIGGQYKLSDQWKLRAGYLYDKNPIKEERFDTTLPDSDRQGVSVGAGYSSGSLSIDAAYMYLRFNDRTITNSQVDDETLVDPNALNGEYKSQVHIAGITIGYKF